MATGNLAVVNFSGGEIDPHVYGRVDLPLNQKGLEWQRNLYSLPQGGSRFRNAWMNVCNTKEHGPGRLVKFEFNNEDTYLLAMYDQSFRVIRDDAPVTMPTQNITAITQANPAQVTIAGHGYSTDDEIFITGVSGMTDINNQFFLVTFVDANNFTLRDTFGNAIDSTQFIAYVSGGTAAKVFEQSSPFAFDDLEDLHYTQNADTVLTARQGYPPFFITRLDHTKWYVTTGQLSSKETITNITQAATGVFTTADEHGLVVGDNVYVVDVGGMTEINGGHWKVNTVPTTTSFTLENTNGTALNTTALTAYTSGGYVLKITHRTADPFGQRILKAITLANPGVFSTTAAHGLKVNDEVYIHGVLGTTQVNDQRLFVNTVPSTTTFTLKNSAGTPLNTSAYTTYRTGGTVTPIAKCPATLCTVQEARLGYANWPAEPDGFIFSMSPDSSTGVQRYSNFTLGANDTDAVKGNLAAIFGTLEAIRWMGTSGDELVMGTTGSVRRLIGKEGNGFLTPSSARAAAVNNVGTSKRQPISNGRTLYYVEDNTRAVRSFVFDLQTDGFNTVDQNLVTANLTEPGIAQVAEQRGRPDIIWALRKDGVLAGMTYKESENIYAWHRHETAGQSRDTENRLQPWGKIISIAVLPRRDDFPRLWAIIEREVNGVQTRYIEYLADKVNYEVVHNFFTGTGYDNQVADIRRWQNSRWEALKHDAYVDSAIKYDGRVVGGDRTLTPGATTGDSITFTVSSAFFEDSMIGRRLIKTYSRWGEGGGVAQITGILSTTEAQCEILSDFDSTDEIPAEQWILTTNEIRGLSIFNGQTVRVQDDGADGGSFEIDNGVLSLGRESGVVHVGLPYTGLWITTNMDVAGVTGSAQAKMRRIINFTMRLFASLGLKVGTTPWNAEEVVLRLNEDLTDTPNPLFDGNVHDTLRDAHSRNSKQICVVKDSPTPLTILSVDAKIEVEDA
jgi:hypothetical protein